MRTDVAVVGAGVVGCAVAFALRARGLSVCLVDRQAPGLGASYGNSGAISTASVAPLAMPGVLASVPRMLLDADAPLRLPPGYLPTALPWLARFVAAARPARVARIAQALADLHAGALENHRELARAAGVPQLVQQRGQLHLYADDAALDADASAWALRARHGHRAERLDRAGLLTLEPAVGERYGAAMFLPDQGMVTDPHAYVQAIARAFAQAGGRLLRHEVRALHPDADGWRLGTADGPLAAAQVVVAAGAWSRALLDPLGVHLPLESQRGYHAAFTVPSPVSRTVVLADRKAFVAPLATGFRIGGTVEFGGLDRAPDMTRADRLARFARETFPVLGEAPHTPWMGHRPCFPDTLPRTGPAEGRPGLWLALGHGHLGLTDSANTARLLAELIAPRD